MALVDIDALKSSQQELQECRDFIDTMLAAAWMPAIDSELYDAMDPDPQDLPQPRVTLFDLTGKSPPRVLIAPHSYLGGLAFSPDGKTLALGGLGAVRLFDLTK